MEYLLLIPIALLAYLLLDERTKREQAEGRWAAERHELVNRILHPEAYAAHNPFAEGRAVSTPEPDEDEPDETYLVGRIERDEVRRPDDEAE